MATSRRSFLAKTTLGIAGLGLAKHSRAELFSDKQNFRLLFQHGVMAYRQMKPHGRSYPEADMPLMPLKQGFVLPKPILMS
jgi:hypothetical protein